MRNLLLLFALCMLCGMPARSQQQVTTPQPHTEGTNPCGGGAAKTKPGESVSNNDGVTLSNDAQSNGDASLDPKGGTASCNSTARTKTGFKGTIDGLDTGDSAILASSNTATVTGTGGYVSVSGGSVVTVSCVSAPGATAMTVGLPGGSTATVSPGSSVTFTT